MALNSINECIHPLQHGIMKQDSYVPYNSQVHHAIGCVIDEGGQVVIYLDLGKCSIMIQHLHMVSVTIFFWQIKHILYLVIDIGLREWLLKM